MNSNYQEMPLSSLKVLAKERGIKNISTLRKQEIIDALSHSESTISGVGKEESVQTVAEAKTDQTKAVQASQEEVKTEPVKTRHGRQERIDTEQIKQEENNKNQENRRHQNTIRRDEGVRRDENIKRGMPKTETSKPEMIRQETIRQDVPRNENIRQENSRPEYFRQENSRQENFRQDNTRMENFKQESFRSENSRQENFRQDNTRQENFRQDNLKQENLRQDAPRGNGNSDMEQLDSGETKEGILEVLSDGYGFIRCDNFLPGENDVYVSPAQIRRFNLKTGDIIVGNTRIRSQNEKFSALLYVKSINGMHPAEAVKRKKFEELTPIFPNERIHLETPGCGVAMRMVDLISPIGKGQRGMIVSQPKAGKTTLLKQVAKAITQNHPEMHLIILLIDERPEEVTDMKESIEGSNVEVIYSTFDELPENHKRVSEMVIERAKRLVEHKKDVVILLDSITRLARAYNLTVQASGRTLSGGLDPAALHMPKKFFGAARNMREGGSLTILATALVETGSRMDDVVFEEFKGTGNMELVLDRSLSEKRIFPAIDLPKSSTRRDDLLLTSAEMEANFLMRKAFNSIKSDDAVERIIQMFLSTKSNTEFIETIKKTKIVF